MNGLSWVVYMADSLPKLAGVAGFVGIVSTLAFAAAMITFFAISGEAKFGHGSSKKGAEEFLPTMSSIVKYLIILMIVSAAMHSFIPSKETFYLIAGSEAGEMAVTSEAGQEILSDIQQVIKHQLGELKGE